MTTDIETESNVSTTSRPIYVESASELSSLVDAHDVVLVDFFATWCAPCQMLDPILGGLAAELDAVIAKVDVDQHQQLAGEFGVRGVPTLVLFAGGEQVERLVGVPPADQLRTLLEDYAN